MIEFQNNKNSFRNIKKLLKDHERVEIIQLA